MSYSPKYVPFDEIPIQIPDDYADNEKEAALEFAEASIELDLNEGEDIPGQALNNLGTYIRAAIKQKATCELVKGAEDPTSTRLGDLQDGGTNKQDYANSFCSRYDEIIYKINESGILGEESESLKGPFVFNTHEHTGSHDEEYR